ncbi:hypothetical protein DRN98_05095 [Methanosarcinales archaeon]|uniref:Secreted protein n=1 Tax=Candidatus Syntropharchaeum caldarium TaxID=1838285 RepID=A0A1F2P9C0_9EURY|nr:MAG: secreted protein [Candidatus Syntrophoarchaeum caldarius]RLG32589.1 MAG: hypothetical protein DRN98_05095 [Methanosarcinales archaeon]
MKTNVKKFGTALIAVISALAILSVGAYPALAREDASSAVENVQMGERIAKRGTPLLGAYNCLNETNNEELAVGGEGWLYAEGRGKALLEGTGIVAFAGVGQIIVIGKDINVMTDGHGRVIKLGYLVTIYRGNGVAVFEGEDMTIFARGRGRLAAKGEGMAIIRGAGDWAKDNWDRWTETSIEPYEEAGAELELVAVE